MSTTEFVGMRLTKATPEDFRIMWKITQYHQNLQWAEGPRVQRLHANGERVHYAAKVGKKAAGRLLDGRTWDGFPS